MREVVGAIGGRSVVRRAILIDAAIGTDLVLPLFGILTLVLVTYWNYGWHQARMKAGDNPWLGRFRWISTAVIALVATIYYSITTIHPPT